MTTIFDNLPTQTMTFIYDATGNIASQAYLTVAQLTSLMSTHKLSRTERMLETECQQLIVAKPI